MVLQFAVHVARVFAMFINLLASPSSLLPIFQVLRCRLWPTTISPILFGHLLRVPCKGKDVKELLSNICAVGAPSTSAAAAKEEEKEESEEDMLSAYLSRSVSCLF